MIQGKAVGIGQGLRKYKRSLLYLILVLALIFFSTQLHLTPTLKDKQTEAQINLVVSRFDSIALATRTGHHVMKERLPKQAETFLKYIPNKIVIGDAKANIGGLDIINVTEVPKDGQGWNNDAKKFFPGLVQLYERFPNSDWYIFIDDDTYVFMDNLLHALRKYNASTPLYFGTGHVFTGCDGVNKIGDGPPFAQGGAGIFMSRAGISKLMKHIPSCIDKYKTCWAGDIQVALCFRDAGILMTHLEGLHTDLPDDSYTFPSDACKLPITFHHVKDSMMYDFEKLEAKKGPGNVTTMADLLEDRWKDLSPFQPDMNRIGHDLLIVESFSAKECETKCKDHSNCVSWVYGEEQHLCWFRDHVPSGTKSTHYVSGILPGRYKCKPSV